MVATPKAGRRCRCLGNLLVARYRVLQGRPPVPNEGFHAGRLFRLVAPVRETPRLSVALFPQCGSGHQTPCWLVQGHLLFLLPRAWGSSVFP